LSKHKTRGQNNCLNCNAVVPHRFCTVCGQENLEPQQTVGHLIGHTFKDFTHFDGKFFYSLKYLITKPGFLSQEYMLGRRMNYLDPVRFYLFTSFLFFLLIFGVFAASFSEDSIEEKHRIKESKKPSKKENLLRADTLKKGDSVKQNFNAQFFDVNVGELINFIKVKNITSQEQLDSVVKVDKVKFGTVQRIFAKKIVKLRGKYKDNADLISQVMLSRAFHTMPQAMFVVLPLLAFILMILYARRDKFYFVSHAIFIIHFYIFCYINIVLINIIGALGEAINWEGSDILTIPLGLGMILYLYWAMRRFYAQGRIKSMLKMFLFLFSSLFVFLFVFIVIIFLTFFNI
jgi:hypothetical protein